MAISPPPHGAACFLQTQQRDDLQETDYSISSFYHRLLLIKKISHRVGEEAVEWKIHPTAMNVHCYWTLPRNHLIQFTTYTLAVPSLIVI